MVCTTTTKVPQMHGNSTGLICTLREEGALGLGEKEKSWIIWKEPGEEGFSTTPRGAVRKGPIRSTKV